MTSNGAPKKQTNRTLSGSPGLGPISVPGIGGGGANLNEWVTCFQRKISRNIVYQLHTQMALPIHRAGI
jgi:hypothetical protein